MGLARTLCSQGLLGQLLRCASAFKHEAQSVWYLTWVGSVSLPPAILGGHGCGELSSKAREQREELTVWFPTPPYLHQQPQTLPQHAPIS